MNVRARNEAMRHVNRVSRPRCVLTMCPAKLHVIDLDCYKRRPFRSTRLARRFPEGSAAGWRARPPRAWRVALSGSGLSWKNNPTAKRSKALGFFPVGKIAIRADLLERLLANVRQLSRDRPFNVNSNMMNTIGVNEEKFALILKSFGRRYGIFVVLRHQSPMYLFLIILRRCQVLSGLKGHI